MSPAPAPPALLRALLRRVVPLDERNAVDGDMYELYAARHADEGPGAAARWYRRETLSLALRFAVDRVGRVLRSLANGGATPSGLDIKLGARLLAKSPGLALVGGLAMAVAVALGAGGYAAVNSYFYPELPLAEGDRVVALGKFDQRREFEDEQLLHDFLVWKRELRAVVDVGAFRTIQRNLATSAGPGEPITLAEMSAAGFRVARVRPLAGRTLVDDDERPGAPLAMVIGYDVWHSRFLGDPQIVGRELRVGRDVYTVVGVMPQGFAFPVNHQYWVPFRLDAGTAVAPGMGPKLDVFARLAPGATKQSAQAELGALGRRLAAEGPAALAQLESRVVPYVDIMMNGEADGTSQAMALARFVLGLLLVVVALNVAVLVYARTVTRTGEIAVRTALGARRARIVTQLFAEALVLSVLSAAAGLGLAAVGLEMLDRYLENASGGRPPFWMDPGLSAGTVLYALGLAVLSAVIIGAFPALRATGRQLRASMGSLGSGARARLGGTWTALIVAQVAVAVAVLPAALRQGGGLLRGATVEPGFAPAEYVATQFGVGQDMYASMGMRTDSARADSVRAIAAALLARLETEPAVRGVTVTNSEPWSGGQAMVESDDAGREPQLVRVLQIDSGYFPLFDVPVVAGRNFVPADAALDWDARPVIVNRSFVDEVLGGRDPVGRRVRNRGYGADVNPWHVVVGVVDDFPTEAEGLGPTIRPRMFRPAAAGEGGSGGLLTVRLRGQSPEAFAPTLRRIAASVDPTLQLSAPQSLYALYREDAQGALQVALVIALVAGSVLLLSAAGIHAMMSFTVNQRRREIGIRAALGAPARRILGGVLARAARQLAIGVGVGLAAAGAPDAAAGGELLGGTGVLLVPGTAAFMLVVGLLAAAGPARRGLRVQPTEALRAE
ncbi:ABC transporter permease [Roseisolibacter sp. H3M3-2]|uniref:ABC transporter permease n=1 Tax=Roseisolibacter sp. H3M3-2 TaxID=3031323 RepID=UPI0023DA331D|nr:ABC transporter permease [Roseisolibacter sp. H3M3-2]MDF1504491.1 ABC transporter permease [Roseisolibacter sp. H3M3-2]